MINSNFASTNTTMIGFNNNKNKIESLKKSRKIATAAGGNEERILKYRQ